MEPKLIIGALSVLAACTLLLAYCLLTMSKRAGSEEPGGPLAIVLKYLKETVMPALDDLKQSVADLGTSISTEIQAVSDKIGALQAAGGATPEDLAALKAQIDGFKSTLDAETAALSAPGAVMNATQYTTGKAEPRWRSRWWLRVRQIGVVQITGDVRTAVHEFYVPWWAKPLDFAHGLFFGKSIILKV